MTENVRKFWEIETIDVPSTTIATFIAKLYGGESITIKSLADSNKIHYIGSSNTMDTLHAYQLDSGEAFSFSLPGSFGVTNFIEIWALAETAGNDICYIKLIDLEPSTEAST